MKLDEKITANPTRMPSHQGNRYQRPPEDPRRVDALIDDTEGFGAAGSFQSMEEALSGIGWDLPDVALLDIGLPGISGIEGVRLLKERYPRACLMLTVYDDDARIFEGHLRRRMRLSAEEHSAGAQRDKQRDASKYRRAADAAGNPNGTNGFAMIELFGRELAGLKRLKPASGLSSMRKRVLPIIAVIVILPACIKRIPKQPLLLRLLSPSSGEAVAQNQADIGSSLDPNHGYGSSTRFQWEAVAGAALYHLHMQRVGSTPPLIDTTIHETLYETKRCGSFRSIGILDGWQWRVEAFDPGGRIRVASKSGLFVGHLAA